jgi:hypothetical protein
MPARWLLVKKSTRRSPPKGVRFVVADDEIPLERLLDAAA